jgi:hypothetical protein
VVICLATLHLYSLQVSSKCRIGFFVSGDSPAHICILHIDPSPQTCSLNVATANFLFGTLDLEVFFCRLSICKYRPFLGQYIMIRILKNFELSEVAIFDNFCVRKRRARWILKWCQSIVALNRITNCSAAASECLRNVFA